MIGFFLSSVDSDLLRECLTTAIDEVFTSRKEVALTMGIRESHLSEMLSGQARLNLWDLAKLGPEFWSAFGAAILKHHGFVLIPPTVAEVLRGAAALGPARMRKMALGGSRLVTLPLGSEKAVNQ